MTVSPNVDNLSLLTGVVKFMVQGAGSYTDLGEVSTLTTSMDFTRLPYMSRRGPSRIQVKSVTTEKTMTVNLTMNEYSSFNLALWAAGSNTGSPNVIQIGDSEKRGALRYIGKNSEGIKVQLDLFDVSFVPNGDAEWLGDEWGALSITGTVYADSSSSFGELRDDTDGTEIPAGSPAI